jgi:hypothetical protein
MKKDYTHKISMMRQMQLINNNNYTFIEAIDGNNSEAIDALYNNAINHYNATRKPNGKYAIEAFKIMNYTKGALGLIASAFKALEDFIKSDCEDDHMLLLEDDVYTLKEFKNELYVNKELLKNKDLVYLGYHNSKICYLYSDGKMWKSSGFTLKKQFDQNPLLTWEEDPKKAATGAHVVMTDTWVSMGCENPEAQTRLLTPYQVNDDVMGRADKKAIFLHCLPAVRGQEVTDAVMDGPQSKVFDQAENRLHAQRALLLWCLQTPRA